MIEGFDWPGNFRDDAITFNYLGNGSLQFFVPSGHHDLEARGFLIVQKADVHADHTGNGQQLLIMIRQDGVNVAAGRGTIVRDHGCPAADG